jgi:hypothetical protein
MHSLRSRPVTAELVLAALAMLGAGCGRAASQLR